MISVARSIAGITLLGAASLLLHGCGLETGSDEGPGNATNPTEPPLDPNTPANRLRLQGLLPGTTLTLQRSDQPERTLTLSQDGEVNLADSGLQGVALKDLRLTPTNTQANQGTRRIQRCTPEADPDDTDGLRIRCREFLFFVTGEATTHELWGTDGTPSGTQRIIITGNDTINSHILYLSVLGNTLYFNARDEAHGDELWHSDGTPQGTRLLADINPHNDNPNIDDKGSRPAGFNFQDMPVAGDWMFFSASVNATERGLWANNGQTIRKLTVPRGPARSRVMGGDLYFLTQTDPMDFYTSLELWKIDGVTTDAQKLLDIGKRLLPTEAQHHVSYIDDLMVPGKRLYFSRRNPADQSKELWYLEKNQPPVKVLELENHIRQQFNDADLQILQSWSQVAALDGVMYFKVEVGRKNSSFLVALDQQTGESLPYSACESPSTRQLTCMTSATQLWRTDGTAQGTALITSLQSRAELYHHVLITKQVPLINGKLYMQSEGRNYIYDLATDQIQDINLGLHSAQWGPQAGKKFFLMAIPENPPQGIAVLYLHVSDGTPQGTQLVQRRGNYPGTLYPLAEGRSVDNAVIGIVNQLAVVRDSFNTGTSTKRQDILLSTDGTPDNTTVLAVMGEK